MTLGTIASVGTIGTLGLGTITGNLGTIGTLGAGSIVVTTGTVNAGTINAATVTAGSIVVTLGTIASVGTIGTLGLGTITGNLGTIGTLGTVQNIGSVTNLGQLYNAGTVQNQLAGTLTALQNGTVTAGSIVVIAGTIAAGTINTGTVNAGTINAGTFVMTAGTLSPIPTIANVTYGTHSTTGASVFGTLAGGTGSGAGTEIFITSLSLTIPSTGGSQDASIGWGTNGGTFQAGTGLIVRGNFPPGGGIQKTFWPPVNSGTQAQLCLFQAGAGTVDVDVTYFITASTL